MLLDVFRYLQIESRIINQDKRIRLPINNILLAKVHIAEDGAEMKQHRNETHIGQFLVMLHQGTANSLHQVPPKETEVGLRIMFFQSTHQIGRMKVARGFAYYQIILHTFKSQVRNSPIMP